MQVGKTVTLDFFWRRPPPGWPLAEAEYAAAGRKSAQEIRSRAQQQPAAPFEEATSTYAGEGQEYSTESRTFESGSSGE